MTSETRSMLIAQAQEAVKRGRAFTTTRPGNDATPLVRDLCIMVSDLINELRPRQEIPRDVTLDPHSKSGQGEKRRYSGAPTRGGRKTAS